MKIILILIMLFSVISIAAQEANDNTENKDYNMQEPGTLSEHFSSQIAREFGTDKISIKFSENGSAKEIYGDLNKSITATNQLEKCFQLFELHRNLFGIANPRQELKLYKTTRDWSNGTASDIALIQVYNDIKVIGGGYTIHFYKDGSIIGAHGSLYPSASQVSTSPLIDEGQAGIIAINDPRAKNSTAEDIMSAEIVIKEYQKVCRLAWKINILNPEDMLGADFYVDSQTGEVIGVSNSLRIDDPNLSK